MRIVVGAVRRGREHAPSLDAPILEAALRGSADRLLTKYLRHGQVIDGIRVENPLP
ncbi:MAG: hypothetical protein M3151_11000 [Actinomycetota bacterium]|nr:hypothetical protein [Actinomycetota bacterium]